MDQFRVHKTQKILEKLNSMNTDVLLIPPGLTFFIQPCDVYLNGPLKRKMRDLWQTYMIETKEDPKKGNLIIIQLILLGRIPKPTRTTLLEWLRKTLDEIQFQDHVFLNTILRDPQDLEKKNEETLFSDEEMDLIIEEEEYDFEELE